MGRESNKKRRAGQAATAREKAAAARATQQRAEQRRRAFRILAAVVVVVLVGAGVAFAVLDHKDSNPNIRLAAPASVVHDIANVPVSTLDSVGQGTIIGAPLPVTGSPLSASGKPELLFIGAEFCPYCAAERWSMAVALSRFGTLSGVELTQSSSTDSDPNTPTLDFLHTTYKSNYLSFVPVETEDRNRDSLQKTTSAENAVWAKYDNGGGYFPFLDFGNKYSVTSPTFDPGVLKGLTQVQVASRLANPTDPVAKAVDGAANLITASICGMTNNQPASVCSDKVISGLQTKIDAQKSS